MLSGNQKNIMLTKGDNKIKFDIVIPMPSVSIYECYVCQGQELEVIMTESGTKVSIHSAHKLLGHCNEETTRKIMKHLGLSITHGSMNPCKSCANTKVRQKT